MFCRPFIRTGSTDVITRNLQSTYLAVPVWKRRIKRVCVQFPIQIEIIRISANFIIAFIYWIYYPQRRQRQYEVCALRGAVVGGWAQIGWHTGCCAGNGNLSRMWNLPFASYNYYELFRRFSWNNVTGPLGGFGLCYYHCIRAEWICSLLSTCASLNRPRHQVKYACTCKCP